MRTLILACLLVVGARASAQIAQAGEVLLFSTKESVPRADTNGIYTVSEFEIAGNKHTRDMIVLRELPFEQGEQYTLADLMERCQDARSRLLNTGLFLDVVVGLKRGEGDEAVIQVNVKERWYFVPMPVLDVVGKTYQQWFQEGMPTSYLRYGVNIKHKNLTGLNDKLSVNLLNGYQKELSLVYEGLPLDYRLRWTASLAFQMGQQRDVQYATEYNKPKALHADNQFLYSYTRLSASVSFRPAIKTRHSFSFAWNDESFRDTVVTDPNSQLTRFRSRIRIGPAPGPMGDYTRLQRLGSVLDAAGGLTTLDYDAEERVRQVEFPEGDKIVYSRDSRGNITEVRRIAKPAAPAPDIVTSWSYPASCTYRAMCN
ncbi:MAG: hypothetical protein EOP50_19465, partial [Sphingobacteriales bacterium]